MMLESAQIQMMELIAEYAAKEERPQIEEDVPLNILKYLMQLGYVEDSNGYWQLTEKGWQILWENKRKLRQEKGDAARNWISIGISAAALLISLLAFLLK